MYNEKQETLKLSAVIARLQTILDAEGDMSVYLDDPDSMWELGIDVSVAVSQEQAVGQRAVFIRAAYDGILNADHVG